MMLAETKPVGMGAICHEGGTAFRVWAPHAQKVAVIGSFNDWDRNRHAMEAEENGYWWVDIPEAKLGDEYRFVLTTPAGELIKIDPYAREVTNSVGNGVIHDPEFDWEGDDFSISPWNELVIYELHIGTFHVADGPATTSPGHSSPTIQQLGQLKKLGVNAIEIMPVAEFAGDVSWGYNPAHIFAVEKAYGGPEGLQGPDQGVPPPGLGGDPRRRL